MITYLGLGSNSGSRAGMLLDAMEMLDSTELRLLRVSSVFESAPMYDTDQDPFLNLVVEMVTTLTPLELLERIRRVEQALGRKRTRPNGPRTIDIDILFFGNRVIESEELTVPHPRLAERRFVLEPLSEIEPGLIHPVLNRTMIDLLKDVEDQDVKQVSP